MLNVSIKVSQTAKMRKSMGRTGSPVINYLPVSWGSPD